MGAMRVIAGSAKGRRLRAPATRGTRPLTDRTKEALFSSLGSLVEGADVLDLFAGSGSIGIEALSRGANGAVFVELGRQAIVALRDNLASTGFDNAAVINQTVGSYLDSPGPAFDIIFCDPPWELSNNEVENLAAAAAGRAKDGAVLIVHRRSSDPELQVVGPWRLATQRRYGDGKIYRYDKEMP